MIIRNEYFFHVPFCSHSLVLTALLQVLLDADTDVW